MKSKMKKRQLGKSDINLSAIGFGGAPIGNLFEQLDELGELPYAELKREIPKTIPRERTLVALGLGTLISDGFLVVQSEEIEELENIGRAVLKQAQVLGAGKRVTKYTKSILENSVLGKWDKLKEELRKITEKEVQINIFEVKRPELDARLVASSIARQIEGRISFRRAIKMSIAGTMRMGAEGIKVKISGRLNGAEMARSEMFKDGRTPLHTFRADIDYALEEAHTTYGRIGIKVWICKGEVYGKRDLSPNLGQSKKGAKQGKFKNRRK